MPGLPPFVLACPRFLYDPLKVLCCQHSHKLTASLLKVLCRRFFDVPLGAGVSALPPKARQKRWSKARPYYARVMAVESLCRLQPLRTAEQKDTVRVDLDLGGSGLAYTPGDALGIYPLNCPQVASPLSCSYVLGMHLHLITPRCVQAAEELLAALGARGDERVPVPSWHYEDAAPVDSRQDGRMPLREALLTCYDLRCVACI